MAARSNRSPSPLSSRPSNPNPRFSESNPSIRRSFSGNNTFSKPSLLANPRRFDPTTPANSPSDFARRRYASIEGAVTHLRDSEEKENNEKDTVLKASKLQSPAKGCKNFMAPTISAASKFTPSPRKKVLVERNDPVRTSISLSDGRALFFSAMPNASEDLEPKPELGSLESNLGDSEKKAVRESLPVSRPSKKVTFSDIPSYSESGITDSDVLGVESMSSIDGDPSLPPYDPKTNYLSPRPQYIRYRPNPRVGMLSNKEEWLDPDDSLMAEIMSQISDSEEASDESHKEEMEFVAESADMVIGMDEEIESQSHVSESLPADTTPVEEGFLQNDVKKPRRSLFRFMSFSMIMMLLLIAATCVSFSIKELSLSDASNAYQQSRAAYERLSFSRLTRHVNHVSASAASIVFEIVNELGKGEKQPPFQFVNLSVLQENPWNDGRFPNIMATLEPVEKIEGEEEVGMDAETDYVEEEENTEEEFVLDDADTFEEEEAFAAYTEVDADEVSPDSVNLTELEQDFHTEIDLYSSDDQPFKHQETEIEDAIEVALETEVAQADASEHHQEPEFEAAIEVVALETEVAQADASEHQQPEFEAAIEAALETELSSQAATDQTSMGELTQAQYSFLARNAVAIPSILLAVAAAAVFIFQHKRNHHPSSSKVVVRDRGLGSSKNIIRQEEFSQNWQTENIQKVASCSYSTGETNEVDGGESYCPSEMSGSFQKSASYSYSADEVESSERKHGAARRYRKRESLASTFSGSPSYGSFTSYERIPIKSSNVKGDDEIVTPVRRSSRIRNQHAMAE